MEKNGRENEMGRFCSSAANVDDIVHRICGGGRKGSYTGSTKLIELSVTVSIAVSSTVALSAGSGVDVKVDVDEDDTDETAPPSAGGK